ncbi:MAG: hypothetical protein AB1730_06440 [Myxococcota bacterium]|jgi:hypothetical protein
MRLVFLLLVLAVPATASAARLLDEEVRLVPAAAHVSLTEATLAADGVAASVTQPIAYGAHFAKTLGLGVFASTAGVLVAVPLGMLSNALLGQLPALLVSLLAGPALTTLAAWLIGNHGDAGRFGYWGAFGVSFALHLATFLVTTLALPIAVAWSNPVALLVYSLIDGLLMTGGAVGFMHLLPNKKPVAAPTVASFVPGVTGTAFVPMSSVAF